MQPEDRRQNSGLAGRPPTLMRFDSQIVSNVSMFETFQPLIPVARDRLNNDDMETGCAGCSKQETGCGGHLNDLSLVRRIRICFPVDAFFPSSEDSPRSQLSASRRSLLIIRRDSRPLLCPVFPARILSCHTGVIKMSSRCHCRHAQTCRKRSRQNHSSDFVIQHFVFPPAS